MIHHTELKDRLNFIKDSSLQQRNMKNLAVILPVACHNLLRSAYAGLCEVNTFQDLEGG